MTIMSTSADLPSTPSRTLWPPPRSPLPPHRLAKLANALGVPTPLPATSNPGRSTNGSPSPSPSYSDTLLFRSQTPSASSVHTFTSPLTSKYLLHIIPPSHLPHLTETDCFDLTPLPVSASGYHSQYERGTLVPLHSTLQSQLLAIAKEYALPSTVGIVLYLVSSTPGRESVNPTPNFDASRQEWYNEQPGPRLSDAIWRHIWTRVVKVEREDALSFLSRTGTPDLAYSASLSSPSLLLDSSTSSHPLRRLISPQKFDDITLPAAYPITPSPSTPSSATDPHARIEPTSKTFEGGFASAEVGGSPSASSLSLEQNADALELPGLNSSSLIPVLAKVEFDIDRQKAAWYEPWLRSRRVNHAKRAESRAQGISESSKHLDEEERKAPIDLRLVDRLQAGRIPEFLREREDDYARLDEDEDDDEITAQFPPVPGDKDPLADVFGTDADTWAEMQSDKIPTTTRRLKNPYVVDLALDGAALSHQGLGDDEDEKIPSHDEHEVQELWDEHSRPQISLPMSSTSQPRMSLSGNAVNRKHVPPPLHLVTPSSNGLVVPQGEPSPMLSSGEESIGLAYLKGDAVNLDISVQVNGSTATLAESDVDGETMKRSPFGLGLDDKRGGAFFDDLDLGLANSIDYDDQQFDENDPYDRRKSQYLLKAKLDEIEKALVQFSPRALKSEFTNSQGQKANLHPRSSVSSSSTLLGPNGVSPSKSSLKESRRSNASQSSIKVEDAVWPAVPYSTIVSEPSRRSTDDDPSLSLPKWTLNGVSTVPPRSPYAAQERSSKVISETNARIQREAENKIYPYLQPPASLDSPIIPLSPDPFGRYPSHVNQFNGAPTEQDPVHSFPRRKSSLAGLDRPENTVPTPSSRFSMDSAVSEEAPSSQKSTQRTSSLVSVKSIRKLWRKSNKESVSTTVPPVHNGASGKISPQLQPVPPLPSKDLPLPPRSPSYNDMLSPPTPSLPSLPPSRAVSRAESSQDHLRLDQEARYPFHYSSISPPPQSVAPLSLASRSSSPSVPPPHPPVDKNGSVRKSILKSWKSTTGSNSQNYDSIRSTVTSDYSSGEYVTTRKGRPSVFDAASSLMRGSVASSIYDIPPSPNLPDHFSNNPSPKAVKNSRSSMRSTRPAPTGSQSSTDSSSPSLVSPLATASPPRHGAAMIRRASRESYGSRSSLDNSQFEMVSPKLNPQGMRSSLSYPYHELDHQE